MHSAPPRTDTCGGFRGTRCHTLTSLVFYSVSANPLAPSTNHCKPQLGSTLLQPQHVMKAPPTGHVVPAAAMPRAAERGGPHKFTEVSQDKGLCCTVSCSRKCKPVPGTFPHHVMSSSCLNPACHAVMQPTGTPTRGQAHGAAQAQLASLPLVGKAPRLS